MNSKNTPSFILHDLQAIPWIQNLVALLQEQNQRIQKQTEEIAALKKTIQEQKDEINHLKNMPKRPKFQPGGGDSKSRSGKPGVDGEKQSNSDNGMTLKKVREEVLVEAANVPEGSRFKGYQEYNVQELELTPKDIIYKLEVWQAPNGNVIRAILPQEVQGSHFGHQLRALVHNLYALGMTEPGLFELLRSSSIEISEGQVHNILMDESAAYQQASEAILTAGIEKAPYIRADDTGAKHQYKNNYCTHIGGEYFAYYKTTASKSRENFLKILLQGKEGYIINEAFIWHLFQSGVEDDLLNLFEEYIGKRIEEGKAFRDGLMTLKQTCARLGISFMGYLKSWFNREPADLANIVRNKYQMIAG